MEAAAVRLYGIGPIGCKGKPCARLEELDEVCIHDKVVYWYKSNCMRVYKSYEFDQPVVDVCFGTFGEDVLLCVLSNKDKIHLYSKSGVLYEVSLPFRAVKLFAMPQGILIQRVAEIMTGKDPVLFSLSHPLEELRPVAIDTTEFFTDPYESICFVSSNDAFLVTRNQSTHCFTLWSSVRHEKTGITMNNITLNSSRPVTTDRSIDLSCLSTEDIEFGQPISAEFALSKIWMSSEDDTQLPRLGNGRSDQAFFVNDSQLRYLCIYDSIVQRLLIQAVRGTQVGPTSCISCQAAIPIQTHGTSVDILLLDPNGRLMLYRGSTPVCCFELPTTEEPLKTPMRTPVSLRISISPIMSSPISTMSNSLSFRTPSKRLAGLSIETIEIAPGLGALDVVYTNQERIRYQASLTAKSALVETVLTALESVLPEHTALGFRCAVLASESDEWQALLVHILGSHGVDESASAWDNLLRSKFHQLRRTSFETRTLKSSMKPKTSPHDESTTRDIFLALHLVYEDYKLHVAGGVECMLTLLDLLVNLVSCFETSEEYLDYYARDFGLPLIQSKQRYHFTPCKTICLPRVPSIMRWIMEMLSEKPSEYQIIQNQPKKNSFGFRTYLITKLYQNLDSVPEILASEQISLTDLDDFPFGIIFPIRQALFDLRSTPPKDCTPQAYKLIGREDLAMAGKKVHVESTTSTIPADDADGLLLVQAMSTQRFGQDRRLKEVCRLLSSARPVRLRLDPKARPELTDQEQIQEQQARLLSLCTRSLALCVGRGMLTLETYCPNTQLLDLPPLILSGVGRNKSHIALDPTSHPKDFTEWAAFHNGVATGLRLMPDHDKISRTWIVYNKPKDKPTMEYAGLLLALGLHGYLSQLTVTDVFEYLSQGHEGTTVGLLIGLAASKRGTMDRSVSKMLCLHLPSLLPAQFSDMDVPILSQTAALIGIGLLYQGTGHRLMTELLLNELSASQSVSEHFESRESYLLSAGMALGLVILGTGSKITLMDLKIPDRLHELITLNKSGVSSSSKCSRLRELQSKVSAPGATMALGFMFMKSQNTTIAQRVAVPQTLFLLDSVRPDIMTLRVIAQYLILWDDIQPTQAFVHSVMPEIILKLFDKPTMEIEYDFETIIQTYFHLLSGACFVIGLKYAGTADEVAKNVLKHYIHYIKSFLVKETKPRHQQAEKNTVETCLASAVQSMGLVMAGTGDLDTLRLLREIRNMESTATYGHHMAFNSAIGLLFLGAGQISIAQTNEAIAALVIAFYPQFPIDSNDHRYHFQPLRHFYTLAAESRYLTAIDVDTKESCYLPLYVEMESKTRVSMTAPCLLPPFNQITRLVTDTSRYYPIDLSTVSRTGQLIVKRKTGQLSYATDPHGFSGLMARATPKEGQSMDDFLRCFTEDPKYFAFCDYFGTVLESCNSILYECLSREKSEMLMTYVSIQETIEGCNSLAMGNLQLILYFQTRNRSKEFLLETDFIMSCNDRLHDMFFTKYQEELTEYVRKGTWTSREMGFSCLLTYLNVPLMKQNFTLSKIIQLEQDYPFTPKETWIQIALMMEKGDYY